MSVNRFRTYIILCLSAVLMSSCGAKQSQAVRHEIARPPFSADSAYAHIATQLSFGPRVPGTDAHADGVDFIAEKLNAYGASVEIEEGYMEDYAGEKQKVRNIIARLGDIEAKHRILLCTHYDSRPWSDQDDEAYRYVGVPAANDGASGVGVLLEIARQLQHKPSAKNIDMVFFDCEDMGTPDFIDNNDRPDTWCLGSQLWAQKPERKGVYSWGILLDMVGAPGATFYKEYYSVRQASNYVDLVWNNAASLGYDDFFKSQEGTAIVDDHLYVHRGLGIPCVDIIHTLPQGGFPEWWHTQEDNLMQIDRNTLQAVGEVLMSLL